ncbi:MAG: hypothetical protein OER90_19995 [Gemmatimonadota bacterium]|nr:hypothetical protein [Gemmatimonadota bacterium]
MRQTMLMAMAVVLIAATAGCATKILDARFSSGSGTPHGPIPFDPSDDHISVLNQQNPVLTAGTLVFSAASEATTSYFTRPVAKTSSTKTIYWEGHLQSGAGPIASFVTAYHTVGNTFPTNPLELRITNNEVKLIGPPPNNTVLHTASLVPNTPHDVFISLRLGTGTYRITIQQPGAPEIVWQGSLPQLTANYIKSQPRLLLMTSFAPGATGTYTMDNVLIREKD